MSEVIVNSASNNQISELIARINHLSWFEKGIELLRVNDSNCPFCDQKIENDLMLLINSSIDQSYKDKKQKVQEYYAFYAKQSGDLVQNLTTKISVIASELDIADAQKNIDIIDLKLKDNLKIIETKLENLNQIVILDKFSDSIKELNLDIEKYNSLVKNHNDVILNRKKEEVELKNKLWSYILFELNEYIKLYQRRYEELDNKIKNACAQVEEK